MGTSISPRISHTHTDPTPPCTTSSLHHLSLGRRVPNPYHVTSSVCLPICLSLRPPNCLSLCLLSVCLSACLSSCPCMLCYCLLLWVAFHINLHAKISMNNYIDSDVIYRKSPSHVWRILFIISICHVTSARRGVRISSTHKIISMLSIRYDSLVLYPNRTTHNSHIVFVP